jgi:hypothetical protein
MGSITLPRLIVGDMSVVLPPSTSLAFALAPAAAPVTQHFFSGSGV